MSIENLTGSNFNDALIGNSVNNVLNGGGGNDALVGNAGDDTLTGGSGNDTLNGGDGIDTASYSTATAGVTVNLGLSGAQNTGGAGIDQLVSIENFIGSNFNDTLRGADFADNVLKGGTANDILYSGDFSNTVFNGGAGADTMYAGYGNNHFDYNSVSDSPAGSGRDVIHDFVGHASHSPKEDYIDLTTIDANTLVSGNQAFTYIGSAAFTAAGQLRYAGGILQGSTDADTVAEFEVQLVGAPAPADGLDFYILL
ncbi:MAG: hypothetical protein JSR29_06065 [Nitrospira sp.]|nr:hypothetical protein [Nitrospira sp.]